MKANSPDEFRNPQEFQRNSKGRQKGLPKSGLLKKKRKLTFVLAFCFISMKHFCIKTERGILYAISSNSPDSLFFLTLSQWKIFPFIVT